MASLKQRVTKALDARTHKGVTAGRHDIVIEKDLRVPMDDGVVLLADLIRPVGADPSLPTIVIRGPYGRRGLLAGSARMLAYEGYTVLFQSCRGTWGSEGVFTPQIDEQRDGIATLRWVRQQPWFTGRLVTYGQSYMGFTQWAVAGTLQRNEPETAPDGHVLLITMPDFGAITWDNGAFALRNALGWSRMMVRMRKGGLALLAQALPDPKLEKAFDVLPLSRGDIAVTGEEVHWYQDWVRHERLTDHYWTQQSHTASVPDVTAPVLMVSGWYDIFLPWQLRTYRQLVEAGNAPRLTVGPWGHVSPGMGEPTHTDTLAFLREAIGGAASTRPAAVRAFQTGAEQWHDLEVWPPAGSAAQPWYLTADGGLETDAAGAGVTTYTYDPQHPTPALGGPSLLPKTAPVDNAAHEQRDDVAAFRSAELAVPVEVAGEPVARIRVRSSAPSFDVFVRLTDVHPDGRVMTVCDGIRRVGSIATTDTDPEPDEEGFREVAVTLWPTFHRFAPGHRIGVQVSSGAHPRYARNPGTGEPAFYAAGTVVARQEVSHDGGLAASRIDLPVWTP
ncbi:CocE/NonD family hydrolase [Microbacterium fluvii]|uniref:CocE/NonD family hydrolase n=1 Tax=Microbacterium fluvii TaxID=415215 RepID=A0ABW2HG26_9MICO|nr:CocE/NonD family hydrolase [Microbacterium fluvii]MCU4673112.1 CocE/NonD family hydrolase [Microbacterium fluvii]